MADTCIVDELDIDIESLAPRSSNNLIEDAGDTSTSAMPDDDDIEDKAFEDDVDRSRSHRSRSLKSQEPYDIPNRRSSTKSKASYTTATTVESSTSSSHHDVLHPLPKLHKPRNSASAEFSIGLSEFGSNHSHDLESSLANRLGAVALEEACERKAQLCLGSCCDLVKGAVIANALQVVYYAIYVNVILTNTYVETSIGPDGKRWGHIFGGLGILMAVGGIWGACKFQKYPVLVNGLWCIFELVLSVVRKRIALAPFAFFFAYPNFHLFWVLHTAKITRENYQKTERYCCCSCLKRKSSDDDDSFCCGE